MLPPRETGSSPHNQLAPACAKREKGETAVFGEKCPVCDVDLTSREYASTVAAMRELGTPN